MKNFRTNPWVTVLGFLVMVLLMGVLPLQASQITLEGKVDQFTLTLTGPSGAMDWSSFSPQIFLSSSGSAGYDPYEEAPCLQQNTTVPGTVSAFDTALTWIRERSLTTTYTTVASESLMEHSLKGYGANPIYYDDGDPPEPGYIDVSAIHYLRFTYIPAVSGSYTLALSGGNYWAKVILDQEGGSANPVDSLEADSHLWINIGDFDNLMYRWSQDAHILQYNTFPPYSQEVSGDLDDLSLAVTGDLVSGRTYEFTFGFSSSYRADTNPVPAPASLLLLGSGLAGLVLYRKRRAVFKG